jgi:ketose-bisphosphate aldolase
MPLVSIDQLLSHCRQRGYAIGYFESWNLESLQGVLDAAEQTRSPTILGFNGEFLSHGGRLAAERIAVYAAMGRAATEAASVPCGLIFNECPCDAAIREAMRLGFNLVMPADPRLPYDDYAAWVRRIVQTAHPRSVAVEAEWGELPCGAAGHDRSQEDDRLDCQGTDPEVAERFVRETGVDLLAVSVGNVHIRLDGASDLDLPRLEAIHRRTSVPLVLHGGTGITAASLREAIRLGVAKVNYGTYLKQAYLTAIGAVLADMPSNPHEVLGWGGTSDALVAGRLAVRDAVLERIETLGCCGRA